MHFSLVTPKENRISRSCLRKLDFLPSMLSKLHVFNVQCSVILSKQCSPYNSKQSNATTYENVLRITTFLIKSSSTERSDVTNHKSALCDSPDSRGWRDQMRRKCKKKCNVVVRSGLSGGLFLETCMYFLGSSISIN